MRKFIEEFGAICLGLIVAILTIVILGSVGGNVNDSATGIFNDFVSNSNAHDKDAIVYRIEYYSQTGKSLGVGSVAAKKGETKEVHPAKKPGYTAPGSQTIKWDSDNKTITFRYAPITYKIEVELNGGKLSSGTNPTSYTIESNDIVLKNPSKSGHTFLGWKGTGIKDGEKNVVIKAGSTGDRRYTADFKINSFETTVIYETASGIRLNEEKITGDYGQSKTITAPEVKGYVKPKDVKVTFNESMQKVVKMQYQPISYNIDISLIGGTLKNKPTSYTIESNDITLGTPTKQGFTFEGWTGINGIHPQKNITIKKGSTGDVYYVANWSGDAYTLTFDARGGTLRPGDEYKVLSYNQKYGTLPTPTRAEHNFLGWYTQPSGGNKVTPDTVITTKNVTVYAQWGANTYTAHFDGNGGSNGQSITRQAGEALGTLPTTSRNGYKFLGWFTARDGGNKISASTIMPSGGATYYAHWGTNQNEYTVNHMTLNVDGSTYSTYKTEKFTANVGDVVTPKIIGIKGFIAPEMQTVTVGNNTVVNYKYDRIKYGFEVSSNGIKGFTNRSTPNGKYYHGATITLNGDITGGYSFESWNSNRPSIITFEKGKNNITFKMPILDNELDVLTAYPTINAKGYFIDYILNGGQLPTNTPYSYYPDNLPLTLDVPTKVGHTFKGWTGSNGTTPQTSVTITKGTTGDKRYEANWQKNQYTLYFDANGGTVNIGSKTLYYDDPYGNLPTPTRPGYKFEGWFTLAEGGQKVDSTTRMRASDTEIHAQWSTSELTYNVIYESASGIELGRTTVTGESGTSTVVRPITKAGYSTPTQQTVVFDTPNKVVKFVYNPITYQIQYNLNGGQFNSTTPKSYYNVETPDFKIPTPVRTGYTFQGWTGSNGNTAQKDVTIRKGTTGNLVYNASWTQNEVVTDYKIYYHSNIPGNDTVVTQGVDAWANFTFKAANTFTHPQGKKFVHWAESPDGVGANYIPGTSLSYYWGQDLHLYAIWEKDEAPTSYTVTYDPNYGNGQQFTQEVPVGQSWRTSDGSKFYKPGYTLDSWNTDRNGRGTRYPLNGYNTNLSNNLTLYAIWKQNSSIEQFTITVDSRPTNGGYVTGGGTYDAGTSVTLKAVPYSGYEFVNWSDGITYPSRNIIVSANISLTANFRKTSTNTALITYHDTYSGAATSQSVTAYSNVILKDANLFSRNGYRIKEWCTNQYGGGTCYAPGSSQYWNTTSETHLYTVWEPDQSYVTLTLRSDANQGKTSGSGRYQYGYTVQIKAIPNPGYEFVRWSDGITYSTRNITLYQDTVLEAEFRRSSSVQTTIIYDSNYNNDSVTQYVMTDSYVSIKDSNTFTRSGYRLTKWCTTSYGSGTCYTPGSSVYWPETASSTRLYAQWEPTQTTTYYTVNLYSNTSEGITEGAGRYQSGSTVQIRALPNYGYEFVNWSDGSTLATRNIVINSNINLTANFRKKASSQTYTVTASPYPNHNYGDVAIDGFYTGQSQASYGQTIELTARPKSGYDFLGWKTSLSGNYVSTASVYRPTIYGNTTYYAIFEIHNEVATRDLVVGPQFNNVLKDLQTQTGRNITAIEFTDGALPTNGTPFTGLDADNDNGIISNYSSYGNGIKVTISSNKVGQKIYANKGSDKMFWDLAYVQDLNLGNLDTSKVTTMYMTFFETGRDASVFSIRGLNDLDVSRVSDFSHLFFNIGHFASNFTIDVSNWIIRDGANINKMFGGSYDTQKRHLGLNAIATPKYIPNNVQYGDQVTSYSWYDASDNYREYTYGQFPIGITSSHVLLRDRPYSAFRSLPDGPELHISLSYDLDDGTIADDAISVIADYSDIEKIPTPTKEGFTFDGWDGLSEIKRGAVSGDVVLKARWK